VLAAMLAKTGRENGQALVETALVLPLVLLLLLGVVQFGIILSGEIAVSSAAREGARLAAVGATDAEISVKVQNMLHNSPLLEAVSVHIEPQGARSFGQPVTVTVEAGTDVIVPFFDLFLGESFRHEADATMRVEYVQEAT